MFKNILVPTDLTDNSRKALNVALDTLSEGKGVITLFHVIESIDGVPYQEFEDFYDKLRRRAQRKMDEIASQYGQGQIHIQRQVAVGKRAREILQFAEEHGVDLIVLSSHPIERSNPTEGWATISYKVAILSQCPVLMVK